MLPFVSTGGVAYLILVRSMMITRRIALIALLGIIGQAVMLAETLWHNGDPNGTTFLANGADMFSFGNAFVYDDFIVPVSSGGWIITGLSGTDNGTTPPNAIWWIRSGMSVGNPGVLIASGTSPATSILTGNVYNGFPEFTLQVTGLRIFLPPGTYWLGLAPDNPGFVTFASGTNGAGAIGQPPGNNGNSFYDNNGNIVAASDFFGGNTTDFSLGVVGSAVVPEPTTSVLALVGLLIFAAIGLRCRKGAHDTQEI
jgi:hypothetical protein